MNAARISDLAALLGTCRVQGDPAVRITGIAHDSRTVRAGDLFVAIPGQNSDGREHVPAALARGATALLIEGPEYPGPVTQILVPSAREALPRAAAAVYGRPGPTQPVIGITGTNGKTTIAYLVAAMLEAAGFRPALVGSIASRFGTLATDAHHTTPEASDLHRFWAEAAARGADALVLEASSHGLLLHRVDGIGFNVGVFTNLTRDHLDYHPDLGAYRAAKSRLFGMLPARGQAILPAADPVREALAAATQARVITYGEDEAATVHARHVDVSAAGIRLDIAAGRRTLQVRSRLYGRFNVGNLLAAVAVGHALKLDADAVARGIENLDAVPGRAQRVDCGQPFVVLNDFAHTPDALARILTAARELTPGALHVVFGCGGERDPGKRPLMGTAAAERADFVTVTSDNPRREDPLSIIRQVTAPLGESEALAVEPDRALAIRAALARLGKGDTLVVAGKGHERYQIVGTEKRRFDDAEVIRTELCRLGYTG